jgi:hypothetical protein
VVRPVQSAEPGAGSGRGQPRGAGPAGQGRRRLQPVDRRSLRRSGDPGREGLPRRRGRRGVRRRRAAGQGEAFFDSLVPSRADELLEKGDELSLREAAELEPRRADIAVRLGRARLARGAEDEALAAVEPHAGDFGAQGIAARIGLQRQGIGSDAFAALDRGEREAALDALIDELASLDGSARGDLAPDEARELLRQAIVGILSEFDPGDPTARDYRRKLAAALN